MPEVLWFLLRVVATPFVFLIDRRIRHRNEQRRGVRAPNDSKPAKLNVTSRRPITPPLPEPSRISPWKKKQNYHDQTASPLFSKLPAELRRMIWKACAEEGTHVFWEHGHMRGSRCLTQETEGDAYTRHMECFKHRKNSWMIHGKGRVKDVRGRLAFVLTCRKIYNEAISILYSAPLFDFSLNYLCLTHVNTLILPDRLNQITAIDYFFDCRGRTPVLQASKPDYFTQVWTSTWNNLAQMQGLKWLRVDVSVYDIFVRQVWIDNQKLILESLEGVRRREFKRFEILGLPFETGPLRAGGGTGSDYSTQRLQ